MKSEYTLIGKLLIFKFYLQVKNKQDQLPLLLSESFLRRSKIQLQYAKPAGAFMTISEKFESRKINIFKNSNEN